MTHSRAEAHGVPSELSPVQTRVTKDRTSGDLLSCGRRLVAASALTTRPAKHACAAGRVGRSDGPWLDARLDTSDAGGPDEWTPGMPCGRMETPVRGLSGRPEQPRVTGRC